jgi:hypothetical protein
VSSTVGKNFLCQKRKLLSFLKKLGVTKLLIHAMLIQYILIRISDWIRTAPEIPDADIHPYEDMAFPDIFWDSLSQNDYQNCKWTDW